MTRRPSYRRLALVAEVLAIGVLGAVIGLLLGGRVTTGVGPFEARMTLGLSRSGGTEVALPPLGELLLDTHAGPLHLGVEVVRLREDEAREIVRDPDRLVGLGEEVRRDLYAGLQRLALQAGAVTVLGAGGLGLLVFRRRGRTALAGLTGVATLLSSAGVVWLSFDETALAQPQYRGLLAVAPSAVGDVRTIVEDFGTYTRSLGKLVNNVTDLYAVTSTLQTFERQVDGVAVLHVSDLHLSPVGLEVMLSVADQFGVDAILDTGDITDFGSAAENRYLAGLSRVTVPYVFTKGNHDSATTVAAMEAAGAIVLDDPAELVEVAGLRLLGSPDPRFTPDKSTGADDTDPEVLLAQGEALRDAVLTGHDPDVVLVHDPVAAGPLRGYVPLVLAGHTHRRDATTVDGTLLLTQGSSGGAGLRGLEGTDPTPLGLSVMYFTDDGDGGLRLQAYDALTLGGLGTSSAQIERRVVPRETPVPTASPFPSLAASSPAPAPTPSPASAR